MKVCDFLSRIHDPQDKPGSRIRPIAMTELAKSWPQGIHDQMMEENDLEDEIDLPAPIRRKSLWLYENEEMDDDEETYNDEETYDDEEMENVEFFGITESNRRMTRSMTATPASSPTVKSQGPTTRSQAKTISCGPKRSPPPAPTAKITRTTSPSPISSK